MEHNDAFLLHHSLFTLRIVSSQHALQVFLLLPVIPEADEGQNTLVDVFSSDLSASECKVLYSAIGGKSGDKQCMMISFWYLLGLYAVGIVIAQCMSQFPFSYPFIYYLQSSSLFGLGSSGKGEIQLHTHYSEHTLWQRSPFWYLLRCIWSWQSVSLFLSYHLGKRLE